MDNFGRSRGIGGFSVLPPMLKTLIVINIFVYLFSGLFLDLLRFGDLPLGAWFTHYFALQPFDGFFGDNFWPWQLISYQFMHGGFWHLAFNMFSLWMFGAELEYLWGSKRFLVYYLATGIGAGLIQLFVAPLLGQMGPTVGASGAVYGLLLAFGMTYPDRQIFMFPLFIPIKAKYFVLIFAAIEMISGFSSSGDGVAHFAHVGGALTGFILLKFGSKLGIFRIFDSVGRKKQETVSRGNVYNLHDETRYYSNTTTSYQAPAQTTSPKQYSVDGELITQEKIDIILDKISASGYQNLTEREKFILTELSKKL